ncbi:MAG: translation initiation factor IF-3 [Anaeroplasmataceae bacterium]|nr:translation initiation factor IF-3 [Anaeroplasmataceae bacterium]
MNIKIRGVFASLLFIYTYGGGIINKQKRGSEDLVNDAIRCKEMLVITDKGEKLGVLPRAKALAEAEDSGLDLVLVSPDSNPPVAKLMDYSRYRFEQQKKLKEMRKNQKVVVVQEIQLSPTIEKHDFETKARKAQTILEKGNKVKISLRFKGRMIVHQELGKEVIERFVERLAECSTLESPIRLEGRTLFAVIAPKTSKD